MPARAYKHSTCCSAYRFRDFGSFLVGKGVTQLDIWRADIDKPTDCTEPWVFEVAEQFLNGTLPPPTSASPLGA